MRGIADGEDAAGDIGIGELSAQREGDAPGERTATAEARGERTDQFFRGRQSARLLYRDAAQRLEEAGRRTHVRHAEQHHERAIGNRGEELVVAPTEVGARGQVDDVVGSDAHEHDIRLELGELLDPVRMPEEEVEALGLNLETMEPKVDIIARAAEAAHEANRVYCAEVLMDNSQLPWAEAPQWQKDSAIAGVNFAIANKFPSPEAMHENWMRDKITAGWKYGPVKNGDLIQGPLTHPSLRPYAELPEVERAKDDIFRKTIMAILGVEDQPIGIGTMSEFGPGEGPAILAGLGAEPIAIETPPAEPLGENGEVLEGAPHDEAKPTP